MSRRRPPRSIHDVREDLRAAIASFVFVLMALALLAEVLQWHTS